MSQIEEGLVIRFRGVDAGLQQQISKANEGIKTFQKSTGAAGQAITNFGRILSDSAFGPLAIANNLEAAALSMKGLSQQSKETGQSIGAILLQQLKGPGGLIAGVSLASAAFSFASVGLSAWTRLFPSNADALEKQKQKIKEAKEALESYIEGLDVVSKADLTGGQNAQQQLVVLKSLYEATQNANVPLADRKKLVDELQEQYPKYFANISDEAILAGKAQSAYEKLSIAILQAAKARAAQDELVAIQKQILVNERQTTDALEKETNAYKTLQSTKKAFQQSDQRAIGSPGVGANNSLGYLNRQAGAESNLKNATKETNRLYQERLELQEKSARLIDSIKQNVVNNGADVLINPKAKLPKEIKIKDQEDLILRKDKVVLVYDELTIANKDLNTANGLPDLKNKFDRVIPNLKPLTIQPRVNVAPIFQANAVNELRDKLEDALNNSFKNIQLAGLTSIGESIGAALSGGNIDNIFKGFLSTLGSAIEALGVKIIELGVLGEATQKAIATLLTNPGAALVAGIGLVAIGSAIKNLSVPKFAEGGLVTGATLGLIGEGQGTSSSNPEVVAPLNKLKSYLADAGGGGRVQVEGIIRGGDILLSNARTYRSQRRGG